MVPTLALYSRGVSKQAWPLASKRHRKPAMDANV